MRWLNLVLSLTASADFLLASLNGLALFGYAREASTPARRAGAAALVLLNAGLALEALLFLSQAPAAGSWTRMAAQLVVRCVLLGATTLLFALVWRAAFRPRRGA